MSQLLNSVCVYCGSRTGTDPAFQAAAKDLGLAIAQNGWRLVYGAGDIGLMGTVADAAQSAGGLVFGVIPEHLFDREIGKRGLNTFVVTETMHERKKVMHKNSDSVVVLPGGAGSLDEFFEVLTWRQLGLHSDPIFVVNINGYWDPLADMLDSMVAQGFADASIKDMYEIVPSVDSTIAGLSAHFQR